MSENETPSCPYCGMDETMEDCILKTVQKTKDGGRTICCEKLVKRRTE